MSRFSQPQDPDFVRLNRSLDFEQRLWPYDVEQSSAHVGMLAAQQIIEEADRDALLAALAQVEEELGNGGFKFHKDDEDIHMAIERRVTEIAGRAGGKLHTARSRNDQVATDVIMFVREHASQALVEVGDLMLALLDVAERHIDWPMPGYTHLQRAQPVYLGHHLLAYFWMLRRDRSRMAFAAREADRLPLGSGALAGVNFDSDRALLARELGFAEVTPNSIDAVSGRDF